MKTFTLDEANELLPMLRSLLQSALESKAQLEQQQQRAQDLVQRVHLSGGSMLKIADLIEGKAERERAAMRLRDLLDEIEATGALVKDMDTGLLDFPCEVDGAVILLCWKMGEPAIAYWHGLDEGFKGRKPIDGSIPGAPKPN